ncbi:MAG: 23S rRNA (guanosine(2251)-2'-O)-methyltransferase RlmB [Bacteroidetes bacterium]|nr:23S rRNA (guanosine(2251)-2'-O)-methyltransferase RlmB [Bacteroidota bacterium]MBS1978392.1 23S rRNA (guanosine(2251)-2'-O)-methyltransferase RlmB [Bacteroidota bacterium]
MDKSDLIYGTRAVMEAIRAGRQIEKIFLQAGLNNDLIKELVEALKAHKIPFSWVPVEKINRLTNRNHQGVVGYLSAVQYATLQQVIDHAYSEGRVPFLLLLDRITDVRNFGAVARTCECAGLDAIVIEEKGSAPVTSDAMKTSAGALHHLPVCRVRSLKDAIKEIRDNGIQIVACTEKAADIIFQADLTAPTALLLGSEEDGISPTLLQGADKLVRIPMTGKIQSLNVSVAAAIAIYEVVRQKSYR